MTNAVNHEMLVLLRESRGLTQSEVAETAAVSQSNVSRMESGILDIDEGSLDRLAAALRYPRDRFFVRDPLYAFQTCGFHYRKRQVVSAKEQKSTNANSTLRSQEITDLLRETEIDTQGGFAPLELDEFDGDPERVAAAVRVRWRLPPGPIANLTATIERCGGIVIKTNFGTDKIDAMSHVRPPTPPLFFINDEMPNDRQRMTEAHEVGHIIMHSTPTPNVEDEANQFAAAFLMPKEDIHSDLCPPLDFGKLRALKAKWRVAMQALIYRARRIGTMSERTYRFMFMQLSQRGWKKREPNEIQPETPQLLDELLKLHREEHGYTVEELSKRVGLLPEEFSRIYLPDQRAHLRLIK